jgi:Sua5/YciO/YrdC/YwlC family protein
MNIREAVDEAITVLKNGGVILYPTDTVWGLGCDATNAKAVDKILAIKGREQGKSLIVIVNSVDMVYRYVESVPEIAPQLIEVADQPLTIIYSKGVGLATNILAEDGSIGIRVVNHPFCNMLLSKFKRPIVSTSANLTGEKTPATFKDISAQIINKADWFADAAFEEGATGKASSVILLGKGGLVKVLRK